MTFGKKSLFSLLLLLVLITNILELTHFNYDHTSTLLSFCTTLLLPGFLLSLILRIGKISFWENLLCIVGLSIAFLELGGLLLNTLLPLFGITNPLALQPIIIGFDGYFLLLFLLAWRRTKPFGVQIRGQWAPAPGTDAAMRIASGQFMGQQLIADNTRAIGHQEEIRPVPVQLHTSRQIRRVLNVLPVFFPILAALGAIVLNNGGSNILTLILLGSIALYSLLLLLLRDKIAVHLFPSALFFISLACLFTTSLRSWYITGSDIEREFYVFQLTNSHHIWSIASYQDAYNACLSITILPTILTNLLSIQDVYVYKIIFQVLFAFSPVLVFFIIRNYTTPVSAFLAAFFFVSFPTFFNDMPMLNRQEIGFIFFGLAIYMILMCSTALPVSMRRFLFVIFGIGVIISHYSTNYLLLALIIFVYIVTRVISLRFVKKLFARLSSIPSFSLRATFPHRVFLNLPLIIILLAMTFIWNYVYTKTSNHAQTVIAEVAMSFILHSDERSSDLSYSIFFAPQPGPQQNLEGYIQSVRQADGASDPVGANASQFFSQSITSKYPSYLLPQKQLAPTPVGTFLSSLHVPVFTIQAGLRSLSADLLQLFFFIGLLGITLFRRKTSFDLHYVLLCLGALVLLVLITILPSISLDYGVLRMFQQFLFITSLLIVIGINSLLFFVNAQKRMIIIGIVAIFFFLNLSGFISHLTGEYYPQMTLDNSGVYYDAYYVQKADVFAMTWLTGNNGSHAPVDTDAAGSNMLLTYAGIPAKDAIFPEVISKNAFVLLLSPDYALVSFDGNALYVNSPKPFLDKNKNHIYDNGKVNIYK